MYFLAPSRTEAQGVAMCEAMAFAMHHINDDLNDELIRNIQKIALQGVTKTNYSESDQPPGEIRRENVS